MDDNGNGTLDLPEFAKGVAESKLKFTDADVRLLFQAFDRNGDGSIQYDEFLRVVRGDMKPNRVALAKQAFTKLDRDGSGEVDWEEIREIYNANKHPAVLEGRKTERQVLEEFLSTFEMHFSDKPDGIVTLDEFIEYYTNVSASIDNDEYFTQMMNSAWNLDGEAAQYKSYEKGWSKDDSKPSGKGKVGVYGGMEKNATGKATISSGMQSADNPFQNMKSYYEGRENPQRKSIAMQKPKQASTYNYAERTGQESTDFTFNQHEGDY
jgi:Ca2+-binding EF-hand superfamily protein